MKTTQSQKINNFFQEITNRTHWTDPYTWVCNPSRNLLRGPFFLGEFVCFFEPGKIRSTASSFSRRDPTTDYLFGGHQQPQTPSFFGSRENQTPQKGPHVRTSARLVFFLCFFPGDFSNIFFRMLNFLRSLGLIRHLDFFVQRCTGEKPRCMGGELWVVGVWLKLRKWGIHMSNEF